jgi:cobaltochelatase CobN
MHLLVRESAGLDETAPAEDLGLKPADVVFLSFSDSDLGTMAATWGGWPNGEGRLDLRLANLARLRHPMSVDLFCDTTLPGTKAVLVRLLGGLDYWRYGCEQVLAICQRLGIPLAIVAGDGRPDPRLAGYSTLPVHDLAAIEALLDASGPVNCRAVLEGMLAQTAHNSVAFPAVVSLPPWGVHVEVPAVGSHATGTAVIVCYRSIVLAADTAPVEALAAALAGRGLAATVLFVPSLKAPDAAAWMRRELACRAPDVILNATAFSARDDARGSPLDTVDCPVLQVILAQLTREAWTASARGLSAADIAMNVALPELDGRLSAGVISFKQPAEHNASLGFSPYLHQPEADGISHAASLAANWAQLHTSQPADRTIALVLSTYPGRADQIAHAVGLDGPQSAATLIGALGDAGYDVAGVPTTSRDLLAALTSGKHQPFLLTDYAAAFDRLPAAFRADVIAAWGEPATDPHARDGAFQLPIHRFGKMLLALQPDRGDAGDRKAGYHDPALPPRHSYIAFYLWMRDVAGIDAMIHLGAHGTLEWLPGKALALSPSCAPMALLGATPVIYPFIVNDPGEAAQAKRRIGAITLGHQTPPLVKTELDGRLLDIERLVDEFSSADGLDPRRRAALMPAVADAVERAGLAEVCGLTSDMSDADKLARIDAFLCDVKELTIRDGLHVLDATEIQAILRALDGRFIQPGPSGAPSRGRADVLPTGRNLYSIDPRGIPTQTAMTNGQRAAFAIMDRYAEDHGEWPRSIVMDLWGSATLRTGGEELATALALLGVKPTWDPGSFRVSGYEIIPPPLLDRPRVDVSLRISGLFRDMFPTQLTLFDRVVQHVASLSEDADINPLAAQQPVDHTGRIFGPAIGSYGTGVMSRIDRGDWNQQSELGETYLAGSSTGYRGETADVTLSTKVGFT